MYQLRAPNSCLIDDIVSRLSVILSDPTATGQFPHQKLLISFPSSFRFPKEFISSQVVVAPGPKSCDEGATCEASKVAVEKGENVVTVPKALKQKQLIKVFESFKYVLWATYILYISVIYRYIYTSLVINIDDVQLSHITLSNFLSHSISLLSFTLIRATKVLRIRKPMRLFGGFDDQKLKQSFEVTSRG